MTQTMRSERGFTMIEVMIAVLLTAIAIVGIIALYMTETRASSFSRHSTEATMLATDKLEKLRTEIAPTSSGDAGLDAQGQTGGLFDRKWTVTTQTDYLDIVVKVGWDENDVGATCSTDANCTLTNFCRTTNKCATRSVVMYGRRGL